MNYQTLTEIKLKIYIDFDGVILGKRYSTFILIYSLLKQHINKTPLSNHILKNFIYKKMMNIAPLRDITLLLNYIHEKNIKCFILTYTPTSDHKLLQFKKDWLLSQNIHIPIINTPDPFNKNLWAEEKSILIDDWKINCQGFSKSGGHSIHYNKENIQKVIQQIDFITSLY